MLLIKTSHLFNHSSLLGNTDFCVIIRTPCFIGVATAFLFFHLTTVESRFFEPPKGNANWFEKLDSSRNQGKITVWLRRKRLLARVIWKFEIMRVREIGIPQYMQSTSVRDNMKRSKTRHPVSLTNTSCSSLAGNSGNRRTSLDSRKRRKSSLLWQWLSKNYSTTWCISLEFVSERDTV